MKKIPSLTGEGARVALEAGITLAANRGWRCAIMVVDATGRIQAQHNTLSATDSTSGVANARAITAAFSGRPTRELPATPARGVENERYRGIYSNGKGGVPILLPKRVFGGEDADTCIGGIGVACIEQDQGEEVAQAALTALLRAFEAELAQDTAA